MICPNCKNDTNNKNVCSICDKVGCLDCVRPLVKAKCEPCFRMNMGECVVEDCNDDIHTKGTSILCCYCNKHCDEDQ